MSLSGVQFTCETEPALSSGSATSMSARIPVIAGAGLCTALGTTLGETWKALCEGRSICDHSRVGVVAALGESRVISLARHAAAEALSGVPTLPVGDTRTALVVGTSKGPVEGWLSATSAQVPRRASEWGLASIAATLARELQLTGPRLTLSAACASGIHALFFAKLMIESGQVDRALVVAAEASIHPLFLGSFQRLGVLTRHGACRPMDRDRDGFLMSEAAAALWLTAADTLPMFREGETQAMHRVAVGKTLIAGDAEHLTRSDEQARALRRLLRESGATGSFDLIHAHATGTVANDGVELAAIEAELGDAHRPPALYSHKAGLGHSLGAAGLVSVVLNWNSHQTGIVPPNVHTTIPLAAERLLIRHRPVHRPINRSVAIAAGFGGALGVANLVTLP